VRQAGQRIFVEKDGEKLLDMPLFKVEAILIYGWCRSRRRRSRCCWKPAWRWLS